MSFREKLFIDKLHKQAKITLDQILRKRRDTMWGETPILIRTRKNKVAGVVRNQLTSIVKPQLHRVQLWSHLLQRKVEVPVTPQMLRYIEACGGLDDYLIKTPDKMLHSDLASRLKWQVLRAQEMRSAASEDRQQAAARQGASSNDSTSNSSSGTATEDPSSSSSRGRGSSPTGTAGPISQTPTAAQDHTSTTPDSQQHASTSTIPGTTTSTWRPMSLGSTRSITTLSSTESDCSAPTHRHTHQPTSITHPHSNLSQGARHVLLLKEALHAERAARYVSTLVPRGL